MLVLTLVKCTLNVLLVMNVSNGVFIFSLIVKLKIFSACVLVKITVLLKSVTIIPSGKHAVMASDCSF